MAFNDSIYPACCIKGGPMSSNIVDINYELFQHSTTAKKETYSIRQLLKLHNLKVIVEDMPVLLPNCHFTNEPSLNQTQSQSIYIICRVANSISLHSERIPQRTKIVSGNEHKIVLLYNVFHVVDSKLKAQPLLPTRHLSSCTV